MRDRFPLLVLAVFIFLAGGGYLLNQAARRGQFAEPLSTYRSAPDGARALYLLAVQAGLDVERRHLDFGDLDPHAGGLALLAVPRLSDDELEKLMAFVAGGGRLLIVEGGEPAERGLADVFGPRRGILDAFGVTLTRSEEPELERRLEPALASPTTRGVEVLEARVAGYLGREDDQPFLSVLIDPHADDRAVAIAFSHGGGRVLAVAAPDLASNRTLARADNARFWLSALGALGGGGVVQFDEFHHGFTGQRSFGAYAARHGMHWALAQLLLGVWLWVAALRRFGPARAVAREERSARGDYLLAMARIYRRGGHREHAAQVLAEGLSRTLAPRAGLTGRASLEQIAAGLAARGRRELARALNAVARAAPEAGRSDGALLSFARTCAVARKLAEPASRQPTKSSPPQPVAARVEKSAPAAHHPRSRG